MIKPLEITKAEHLEGYRLLVWFNDGAYIYFNSEKE